jgi:energy-coupling factor transporter ATP-binding protein EcfA2
MEILSTLAKSITILIAMGGGIAAFKIIFDATHDPIVSLLCFIVFEIAAFAIGVSTKIWQKLEGKWIEQIANHLDKTAKIRLSDYRPRYLEYITYQHRVFDVKGLRSQGPYNLELNQVFVQLSVDPTPPHQSTPNPLNIPQKLRTNAHTIWEYINANGMGNQNLAILGAPGSGKTTLLKHIALTLAGPQDRRQKIGVSNPVPVLLFLRDHAADIQANQDIRLAVLIRKQLERREAPLPPDGWLEDQLDNGNCLVMLDGLDEVADLAARRKVVAWVEKCMGAYGKNRFIVASRPHGYKTNPLANVTVLQIRAFTSDQVKQFVHNWYLANELMSSQRDDPGVRVDAKQGAEDLLKRIYDTPALNDLTVNPLLLTMIATVHRYRSSLPGRRVELYAEICIVFLGKRQEAKGLVSDSDLTPIQKQLVLQVLAYHMMQNNVREIKQADIPSVISACLASVSPNADCKDFIKNIEDTSGLFVEREPGEYGFSHLTFQEYLASVQALENQLEDELIHQATQSSWWYETIRLYCAQTNASNIILACLAGPTISTLELVIDCMEEAREINLQTRQKYEDTIQKLLNSPDPNIRRLIVEARLKARLRI